MKQVITNGAWVVLAVLLSAGTQAASKQSFTEILAEHDYRVGEAVEQVPGFDFENWEYLDSKHLVVFGEASQAYLVTLEYRCYGLGGKRVTVRQRKPGVLGPHDQFQVRYEGRTADRCDVEELHRLVSVKDG